MKLHTLFLLTALTCSYAKAGHRVEHLLTNDSSRKIFELLGPASHTSDLIFPADLSCKVLLERPEIKEPAYISRPGQNILRCISTKAAIDWSFDFAGEKIDGIGGSLYKTSFTLQGEFASKLFESLRKAYEASPLDPTLDNLDLLCDAPVAGNICTRSFMIAQKSVRKPVAIADSSPSAISCDQNTEFSTAAKTELRRLSQAGQKQMAQTADPEEQQKIFEQTSKSIEDYLLSPRKAGWLERQLEAGLRVVYKTTCVWSEVLGK